MARRTAGGRRRGLSAVILAGLVALAGGCSTAQSESTLEVTVTPNPVTGNTAGGVRRWDYTVAIGNPTATAVSVEGYFFEISGTDTGFSRPLQLVTDSAAVGVEIPPGGSWSYAANEEWATFTTGTARRIYKARGEDGAYYTGDVEIRLQ